MLLCSSGLEQTRHGYSRVRRAGSLEGAAPSNNPGQALRQLSSASTLEPVEASQRGGVQKPPPFA